MKEVVWLAGGTGWRCCSTNISTGGTVAGTGDAFRCSGAIRYETSWTGGNAFFVG